MPCDERLPEPGWRAHDIAGAVQKPTPVDDLIVWTDPVMAIGASAHPRAGYPCACDGAHFNISIFRKRPDWRLCRLNCRVAL